MEKPKPKTTELVEFIERFREVTGHNPRCVSVSLTEWGQLSEEHGLAYPIERLNGVPIRLRAGEPN